MYYSCLCVSENTRVSQADLVRGWALELAPMGVQTQATDGVGALFRRTESTSDLMRRFDSGWSRALQCPRKRLDGMPSLSRVWEGIVLPMGQTRAESSSRTTQIFPNDR
jgi:hypothetical protein